MKQHGLCDITPLIPMWISCHGLIRGLNGLRGTTPDKHDLNWMDTIYFEKLLLTPPRKSMPKAAVESLFQNHYQHRLLVLKLLGNYISDTFQQLQALGDSDCIRPYNNDYDLVTGYDMYDRLWHLYHTQWDQQTRITLSLAKPIAQQLAFPPKSLKWHTNLDKTDYIPRNKWDKRQIINDFQATLQPHQTIELENIDVFDLPMPMETGGDDTVLLAELDQLLEFYYIPITTRAHHSTIMDADLVKEDLLNDVPHLLANLDLKDKAIKDISDRFASADVRLTDFLQSLFGVKRHDQDLLLNRILLFANRHIDSIASLDTNSKQIVNTFILDLTNLINCLNIRQIPNQNENKWLENYQSVHQLEVILQNQIHMNQQALKPLQAADCVDINRFQTSTLVHQLTRAYDLYLLANSFMIQQFTTTNTIFSKLFADISTRRVSDTTGPPCLLKYAMVRHPGHGSLIQLCKQDPLPTPGHSGIPVAAKKPRIGTNSGTLVTVNDTTESGEGPNSRAATLDLLSEDEQC